MTVMMLTVSQAASVEWSKRICACKGTGVQVVLTTPGSKEG